MKNNSPTIPKIDKTKVGTHNFSWLRDRGLEHIQQLAGKIWTDYNSHDPGVTILEALCYALTDLSYRTSFPIKDIIAEEENNEQAMHEQFLSALNILPSRPVTINDYRKLLVDIAGIKNAWLEKSDSEIPVFFSAEDGELSTTDTADGEQEELELNGLYNVIIEFAENVPEAGHNALLRKARTRLQENRNLAEDFTGFVQIGHQEFIVCGEIELDADANIEKVEARIFYEIQKYLTPLVKSYSLKEMLDKGKKIEEIFEGTLFQDRQLIFDHGFIDEDELVSSELIENINLSDIYNIIMDIDGVKAIKDLLVRPPGEDQGSSENTKWRIPVRKKHQARIEIAGSRFVYYKDLLPFRADQATMMDNLTELREKDEILTATKKVEDLSMPIGEYVHPNEYISVSNEFPLNYGIGPYGLPDHANQERKAQAKQLKAYLLFFDQILTNYFAQLSNIKQLFSNDEGISKTYFSQVVEQMKNMDELYIDWAGLEEDLSELAENPTLFYKRRNEFLDHLLARFNEQFNEYVLMIYSLSGEANSGAGLINDKAKFLQDYAMLSKHRGGAFNYTIEDELWDTYNVSGLQHRIARLTGIINYSRRNLAKAVFNIYDEEDLDTLTEYRFRVKDKETGKILISASTRYLDKVKARKEMRQGLNLGIDINSYQKKQAKDGRHYFNIVDETDEVVARRIEFFKTEEERDEAVNFLRNFLIEKYTGEGLFLVEHILLRPKTNLYPVMPICPEDSVAGCPAPNPYSYTISVILPAWEERFADIYFRRFFEKTLRLETPAHIYPRICWVNQEQMSEFEDKFKAWLIANQKYPNGGPIYRKALKELIDILSRLKNIYPEGTLYDCLEGDDANPIVLGSTTVGSFDDMLPKK